MHFEAHYGKGENYSDTSLSHKLLSLRWNSLDFWRNLCHSLELCSENFSIIKSRGMLHRRECPAQGYANLLCTAPALVVCLEANMRKLSFLSPCLISNVAMSFNDNDEKKLEISKFLLYPEF